MDKIPRSSQGAFDQPHIPGTICSAMFSDLLVMDGKNNRRVDPFPVRFHLPASSSRISRSSRMIRSAAFICAGNFSFKAVNLKAPSFESVIYTVPPSATFNRDSASLGITIPRELPILRIFKSNMINIFVDCLSDSLNHRIQPADYLTVADPIYNEFNLLAGFDSGTQCKLRQSIKLIQYLGIVLAKDSFRFNHTFITSI